MTRPEQAQAFIIAAGWESARVIPLAGDASNRRYDRLIAPDGKTAVLMDAPPEKGEDVRPFVEIATFLESLGLSTPRILHQDASLGFLLLEDLGDRLFARDVRADPTVEHALYRAAIDVLNTLHKAPPPPLAVYDAATTVPLAALAYDWYQLGAKGSVDTAARSRFCAAFEKRITPFDPDLSVLIQRDYHAENLLWLPDRDGVARVGLLDFQDAMLGHPVYDLVSVLQDARRDVDPAIAQEMMDTFAANTHLDRIEFNRAFAVFGLQRNLRILGVFARLCMRDSKPHYVDLIPRVWNHILTNLQHPELADIGETIIRDLPAPSPEVCKMLKEKCGLWAGR
ncbi:MAG: aminoglycoside phosphotransferase family protein [Roseobacter sp.]